MDKHTTTGTTTLPTPAALDEEGTWWWELSLPRTACREHIDARYRELLASQKNADDIDRLHRAYSAATLQCSLPTPDALGLPPLLRVDDLARGGLHLNIEAARASIRAVMDDLRYISHYLNARASDDDFDQPNAADVAIEELRLALTALGGQA
jgi:hypothetical protein